MRFALRKPCRDCPFRSDREVPFFGKDSRGLERAQELSQSFSQNHLFPCHKTAEWVEDERTGDVVQQETDKTSACAGMVIMAQRSSRGSNILRIAARVGAYDPASMDDSAPVYADYDAFIRDHDPDQE